MPKFGPKFSRDIWVRFGGRCHYCGCEMKRTGNSPERFTIDHKIPISRGGGSETANLVASCLACNGAKGARTDGEFIAWLEAGQGGDIEARRLKRKIEEAQAKREQELARRRGGPDAQVMRVKVFAEEEGGGFSAKLFECARVVRR